MTQTQERSVRARLWRLLMQCPHRELTQADPTFADVMGDDPMFGGQACVALAGSTASGNYGGLLPDYRRGFQRDLNLPKRGEFNEIRDLGELGVAHLLMSPFGRHREAGRCLFQLLEPYRAARVAFHILDNHSGNRQVGGAVEDYLRMLESADNRFDKAVLRNRGDLKRLYKAFHIAPNERAQAILFDDEPPEESAPWAVKALAHADDPAEQARLIINYDIPHYVASSCVRLTPATVVAMIDAMSPSEAVNARSWLERGNWLQDRRIKDLYLDKVGEAESDQRASATAMKHRASTRGQDTEVEQAIERGREAQVASGAKIERKTHLYVDVSASMETAIEVAKHVAAKIAPLAEEPMTMMAFRDYVADITPPSWDLGSLEQSMEMLSPGGRTTLGGALQKALQRGDVPDQVVYVTDQGENEPPALPNVYDQAIQWGADPQFVFINVGNTTTEKVSRQLADKGARVEVFHFDPDTDRPGWYAELDQFIPVMTGPGPLSLVDRIMDLDLPERASEPQAEAVPA